MVDYIPVGEVSEDGEIYDEHSPDENLRKGLLDWHDDEVECLRIYRNSDSLGDPRHGRE